ncbi:hypothetical protein BO70DRAFT_130144 [Aspergillus heteromorphus CBS 117.55]|uniref:Uncharacterized protein n=1 Tax=Aspergillus heteromorphus CBS 117.55 TaxID=1448321 RepID=A0A317WYS4_9EURO|nr:uncharacterized protein BO70DRAFT_130144 [Aspergillus heteromorphus CBS 117.55]PWY89878.1 hypothetical protein BO70DRAFT_130144 [Aspergillus heteromorphus CBS 117.55]
MAVSGWLHCFRASTGSPVFCSPTALIPFIHCLLLPPVHRRWSHHCIEYSVLYSDPRLLLICRMIRNQCSPPIARLGRSRSPEGTHRNPSLILPSPTQDRPTRRHIRGLATPALCRRFSASSMIHLNAQSHQGLSS